MQTFPSKNRRFFVLRSLLAKHHSICHLHAAVFLVFLVNSAFYSFAVVDDASSIPVC